MLSSTTIPILLLIIVLMQSASVPQPQEQCHEAPSRNRLEEIWGKPVECVFGTDHVCFRKNGISFSAHFDSSNRAETIFMLSDISQPTKLIDRLVPKDDRGRCLKCQGQISLSMSCHKTNVEEYQCLTIEYSEESCADLNLVTVKIKWK
jgi:hypothetical protein